MKIVQFKRGHKVYTEGQSSIDGIYFIIAGDFEVTRQIKPDVQTEMGQTQARRALSRQAMPTEAKSQGEELIRNVSRHTRSQMLLKKINEGGGDKNGLQKAMRILRLVILGKNELFGLEEIMANTNTRAKTIECTSDGQCYYL